MRNITKIIAVLSILAFPDNIFAENLQSGISADPRYKLCMKFEDGPRRDGCITDVVRISGYKDKKQCEGINDEERRLRCRARIAEKTGDSSSCNSDFVGEENIDFCIMEVAIKTGAPAICHKANESSRCFFDVGQELADVKLCEMAGDKSDLCKQIVGQKKKDPQICRSITDDSHRNTCLGTVAERTKQPGLCQEITDEYLKEYCSTAASYKERKTGDVDSLNEKQPICKGDYIYKTYVHYLCPDCNADATIYFQGIVKDNISLSYEEIFNNGKRQRYADINIPIIDKKVSYLNVGDNKTTLKIFSDFETGCITYEKDDYVDSFMIRRISDLGQRPVFHSSPDFDMDRRL